MSEQKLISPLLDGFAIGRLISDHDGVRCYPALKENSDNKYIVKIISVPASQVQLDALLLTGAYQDPASAMDYFKELADGVVEEAQLLHKLSKLEGFLPYEDWQAAPMGDNQLGYQIYLVGSYKRTLEKHMRRQPMTHLGAVNLGLDMCAALAAARRADMIYVDLKPSNIFISEDREYRIGDLGFMDMKNLQFTSLPSKYCSQYTAPELRDALTTLNTTADTYALGAILYQIYNNGQLAQIPEDEPAPAPANADYELAEIILKAMAPKPGDRWKDPVEMGQALVAYMQRNAVNDTPISPIAAVPEKKVPQADAAVPPAPEEMPEEVIEEESPVDSAPAVIPVPEQSPEDAEAAVETAKGSPLAVLKKLVVKEKATDSYADEDSGEDGDAGEPHTKKNWVVPIVSALILVLLIGCGYYFYRSYFVQTIDSLSVDGKEDRIAVILDTDIDNSLLTVVCTDSYGNTMRKEVNNNKAVFSELLPDTQYMIRVEISGFHKLEGSVSHSYNTVAQTVISDFQAVTGAEDGSAVITFTVDGPETEDWTVTYAAPGEEAQTVTFSGHMVTIPGLTIGTKYDFTLAPTAELYIAGETALEFTASRIVVAENLQVTAYEGEQLTVQWNAPADTEVESWSVRYYTDDGFDKTIITNETTVTFGQIDSQKEYTIEVTAAGMTQPARVSVSSVPLLVSNIAVNTDNPMALAVSWDFEGASAPGGWLLLYRIDGSQTQEVVQCEEASGVIQPRIPGAKYTITIQAADGRSVFGGELTYQCPNADIFSSELNAFYTTKTEALSANLLVTPNIPNWSYKDITGGYYTTKFKVGQPISLVLRCPIDFRVLNEDISILYVLRNSEGEVMTDLIGQETRDWRAMWVNTDYHFCELDLPYVPSEPGEYSLYLYFNGGAVTILTFTISE